MSTTRNLTVATCGFIVGFVLTAVGPAYGQAAHSDTFTQDGLRHYIETDKAVYGLGEPVTILHRLTNLRDSAVHFVSADCCWFEFSIYLAGTKKWGVPEYCCQAITYESLCPDESLVDSAVWDQSGGGLWGDGLPAVPGVYTAYAAVTAKGLTDLDPDPIAMEISIQVIPEPATGILLGLAAGVCLRRPRR